jgi:hypothetical protein
MAKPSLPREFAAAAAGMQFAQVSGNPIAGVPKATASMASSTAIFQHGRKANPQTDRHMLAKPWQVEVYRHVNICGEARYAVTLFAALASRAEIGVSEPDALQRKAVWVTDGPEVEAFAELAPTVRERTKLIRDYMTHRTIAGECYLIARKRVDTDPGYIPPPDGFDGTWDDYIRENPTDVFSGESAIEDPNPPLWEIVAVTELQKIGTTWKIRHDNNHFLELADDDPVIRMWNPDPENRREAWSPLRSMVSTLREIEWLTMHIFTQVRSRLMSAGVWFLPNNMTFPPPPVDAVEGGAEAIAAMNEAEQFMTSLAASSMAMLDPEEVSFPSVVMADPAALAAIDQKKLIQFWSNIDDKAMILRSDAVRRFALGMDLPPEQVIGSSGIAVTGSSGGAGAINHWGVWANEEQTITAHIEPALDDFVAVLTYAVIRRAVEGTEKVIGYDTATLRLRQDRSKEAVELYDRGLLSGEVTLREVGFDPAHDAMDETEFRKWLLVRIAGGSATPEQVQAAMSLLGAVLPITAPAPGDQSVPAPGQPGRNNPPSLENHPYEGPPRVQHDQTQAPYSAEVAAAEVLVLRALEKAGNVLLNGGKRGREKDRSTPPHMAHVLAAVEDVPKFDFSLASTVYADLTAAQRAEKERQLGSLCADLYRTGTPYTREALIEAVSAP